MPDCPCGGRLRYSHPKVIDLWNRPRDEYEYCLRCGFSWGVRDE